MITGTEIKEMAKKAGFHIAAITSSQTLEKDEGHLLEWIRMGHAGEMQYMTRTAQKRARPKEILASSKSVIVCGLNYYSQLDVSHREKEPTDEKESILGRISKYAVGKDYHMVIEKHMNRFEELMKARWGNELETRWYVDYGPVLEKAFAQRAGLGFIGKNTLLITRAFGSWVFLGVLFTNLEIKPDQPETNHCGTCTLCLEACPTQALIGPFQLDSRKCISYLTIEQKGEIEESLRPKMGDWIFGCDVCQEVCPYNDHPVQTSEVEFNPSRGTGPFLHIQKLLPIKSQSEFKQQFEETPIIRAKRKGLLRNAAVVLDNNNTNSARSLGRTFRMQEKEDLILEHLQWVGD